MTTFSRAIRIALIALTTLIALVVVVAVVVFQTAWGGRQLASLAERQLEQRLRADISIGEISGNPLSSPTIHDVAITRDGKPLISAERVEVRYDLPQVLRGDLAIDEVTLIKPVVHLVEGPEGVTLFDLFQPEETAPRGPPRPFAIAPIVIIDGHVVIDRDIDTHPSFEMPDELRQVQARVGIAREANEIEIRIDQLSFVAVDPTLVMERVTGGIQIGQRDVVLEQLAIRTEHSALTVDGAFENIRGPGRSQ